MPNTTLKVPAGRGCGFRDPGSAYLCNGLSFGGKEIEHFLLDPARPYEEGELKYRRSRAPGLLKDAHGIYHVAIFLSKKDYPAAWDFVEESRVYGISRKVGGTFPFEKLTLGKSQMLFFHEYSIPDFDYVIVSEDAPLSGCHKADKYTSEKWEQVVPGEHPFNDIFEPCTLALKDLAYHSHMKDAEPTFDANPENTQYIKSYRISGPSYDYEVKLPAFPDGENCFKSASELSWVLGAFLRIPITHVEYKDYVDSKTAEKVNKAGLEYFVLEY